MPRPTTWLGRQANGWAQMMFGVPCSMRCIISATSSQPSPAWVPSEMTLWARAAMSWMRSGTSNLPFVAASARSAVLWVCSMHHSASLLRYRPDLSRPKFS